MSNDPSTPTHDELLDDIDAAAGADAKPAQPDVVALEAMTRGEVDIMVRTARAYPRSLSRFTRTGMELVSLDKVTADECNYSLPRKEVDRATGRKKTKLIEGPSARFAEIMASAYEHVHVGSRILDIGERVVTLQGVAWDLQANVRRSSEIQRRIVDKHGRRYSDDMIAVTTAAGSSIAERNAILKVIPKALWRPIYEKARRVAAGDTTTIAKNRTEALAWFEKKGVDPARVFALLEVNGPEDISLDGLATLRGLANAIKDNEITIDDAFPRAEPKAPVRSQPKPEPPGENRLHLADTDLHEVKPADVPPAVDEVVAAQDAVDDVLAETTWPADAITSLFEGTARPAKRRTAKAEPPSETGPRIGVATGTEAHLAIVDVAAIRAPEGTYYDIRARRHAEGQAPVVFIFETRDPMLYEQAQSCVGSPRTFVITWHRSTRVDGSQMRVVDRIVAED